MTQHDKPDIQAVIFDLDGVLCSTDHFHFQAWKVIADEENIEFNEEINHRLRGVSRMGSLEIILEKASRPYTHPEKEALCEKKNKLYVSLLASLTKNDLLPGVQHVLTTLRGNKVLLAVGSSSRNAPLILDKLGLGSFFDAVADGSEIVHSKPDPEVFLLAAQKLGVSSEHCLVVEDATAGIEAAHRAGMLSAGISQAFDAPHCSVSLHKIEDVVTFLKI